MQKKISDRPKIIEKFSQPADENGHVLLPGRKLSKLPKTTPDWFLLMLECIEKYQNTLT